MELNWKCSFSTFTYPIIYKVVFWYFKSLCNRNTVSNKTYQYFRDKSLIRPESKYSNRPQPISYKTKFSQRDNIHLVDLKYNITYQNIRLRSDQFLCPEKSKMAKMFPKNLHGRAFYKIVKFVLTKKVY